MGLKATVSLFFIVCLPAAAADVGDSIINRAAAAYGKQKYSDSIKLLEPLKRLNPKHPLLHYYLGNNYCAQGNWSGAKHEYETCLQLKPPADVGRLCIKALDSMEPHFPGGHPIAEPAPAQPTAPATPPPSTTAALTLNVPAISQQAKESIDTYTSQYHKRIEENERLAQAKIDTVERETKDLIDALPRYIYIARRQLPSPDYEREAELARAQAKERTRVIKEFLSRANADARAELDRQIADVSAMKANFLSAVKSDHGPIQMMPNGSGLRVKNYINFGEDSQPLPPVVVPLKATQEQYKKK